MAVDKNIPACFGQFFNLPGYNPGLGRKDQLDVIFHFRPGPVDQDILGSASDIYSQYPVKILLVLLGQLIPQALLCILSSCLHYITVTGIMHSYPGAFAELFRELRTKTSNPDPASGF